ncbi:type II secretion system protein [candidate division WWE3 bacterium]|nr:type II secretion system protein [candidate division WWE3 bacterium]
MKKGFTLIEVVVAVALIIIIAGVTGDIVVSIVRSYNKTQITNEIEQNGNFIVSKIEKELKNALAVAEPASVGGQVRKLVFTKEIDGALVSVVYEIKIDDAGIGSIFRKEGTGMEYQLTNNDAVSGVELSVADSYFSLLGQNPSVVKIHMKFRQIGTPSQSFVGDVDLDAVAVVRGTY